MADPVQLGLSFLTKEPHYECYSHEDDQWHSCKKDKICGEGLSKDEYRPVHDDDYIDNWEEKFELTCEPKFKVGLFGTFFFIGVVSTLLVYPPLADKYGRKWPYISSLLLQTCAYVLIIISKDILATISYYLIVGLAAGGRVAVGTNYLAEFMPVKHQGSICSIINAFDASVMIFQSIYYIFSRNWFPLHIF